MWNKVVEVTDYSRVIGFILGPPLHGHQTFNPTSFVSSDPTSTMSPTPQHAAAPNFLDSAVRKHFVNNIQLVATCTTGELRSIRDDLLRLLSLQPVRTDADCNQALYAAALLATANELLGTRPPDVSSSSSSDSSASSASDALLRNPIESTAVRVLAEPPHGEQRLALVMRLYDHFPELDEAARQRLLERAVSAVGQAQQPSATDRRTEAQRLLDRIARLPTLAEMRAVVERIVRLHRWPGAGRSALQLDHLLDVLLTPAGDLARHPVACLVYQHLVRTLRANRASMAEFLRRLVALLDDDEAGVGRFQQCLRLQRLYEAVAEALAQRLAAVRVLETGCEPDGYSLCVPAEGERRREAPALRWRLADVRRVCACMLAVGSPVRRRFAERLAAVKMAGAVRKLVVTDALLVYD